MDTAPEIDSNQILLGNLEMGARISQSVVGSRAGTVSPQSRAGQAGTGTGGAREAKLQRTRWSAERQAMGPEMEGRRAVRQRAVLPAS